MYKIILLSLCILYPCTIFSKSPKDIDDGKITGIYEENGYYYINAKEINAYNSRKHNNVKLAGIKAFEDNEEIKVMALDYMDKRLLNKKFDIDYDKKMKGWIVIRRNRSFNEDLVKEGYVNCTAEGDYQRAARTAVAKNNGIWKLKEQELIQKAKDEKAKKEQTTLLEKDKSHTDANKDSDNEGLAENDRSKFWGAMEEQSSIDADSSNKFEKKDPNYVERIHTFQTGSAYIIPIYGADQFYERATVPRTLYVFSNQKKKRIYYIIVGLDFRNVEDLRPNEKITVEGFYLKHIKVKYGSKSYDMPVFRYTGRSNLTDPGGTLKYFL